MQLRVARLCLDCEELHTESSCPVCASDRYAFLSNWLPVEVNGIGLLEAGDGQVIDTNMGRQGGAVINYFSHIFSSQGL